jgi:hypothetical protein
VSMAQDAGEIDDNGWRIAEWQRQRAFR